MMTSSGIQPAAPVFKEKLRLRCYKLPLADEDMVYLELKRKLAGVVNKRRATLRFGDAREFLASGRFPADLAGIDRQVLAEIAALLEHCQCRPKVYLSYERLALHGREDPAFRVTFDRSIPDPARPTGFYHWRLWLRAAR